MLFDNLLIAYVLMALVVAMIVSFLMTPPVKAFAYKVGAIDVPKDNRRMHKVPIPRLGGLAIFIGFMVSTLIFASGQYLLRRAIVSSIIASKSG